MEALEETDPIGRFRSWYAEAHARESADASAMAIATVDASGAPSVRMVLLKDADERGFVFYTNTESRKAVQLALNPRAALVLNWPVLQRQVRVEGEVARVSDEEADAYFATRARGSQIGAWASDQSRPIESRLALERRVAQYTLKFGVGRVPRPPHWTGYRVVPRLIEFWSQGNFRLHERIEYTRTATGWSMRRLFP
jgi:pyridoxamine 5'-phosphate oxidase